jgi:GT2 family glycosyltransferase
VTIHILLPVHNRLALTQRFVASLQQQTCSEPWHLWVIDDGSSDGSGEVLAALPNTTALTGDGTLWWAGSIQRGLQAVLPVLDDDDWVYLANNDTALEPDHLVHMIRAGQAHPNAVIGSIGVEIWQDGTRYPVATGFNPDPVTLEVPGVPGTITEPTPALALAGRGMLLPASAARCVRMHPRAMPQHFADLAMTNALRRAGFDLVVEPAARADSLERAGSSTELRPTITGMLSKRSQLYLPAMWAFWWQLSTPWQRCTLLPRFLARAARQLAQRRYAVSAKAWS